MLGPRIMLGREESGDRLSIATADDDISNVSIKVEVGEEGTTSPTTPTSKSSVPSVFKVDLQNLVRFNSRVAGLVKPKGAIKIEKENDDLNVKPSEIVYNVKTKTEAVRIEEEEDDKTDNTRVGVVELDTNTVAVPPPPPLKNTLKSRKGHVITTVIKKRIFLCALCHAQVSSLPSLVVHLDREHNIRAKGPPRIVEELDTKEDLKITSNLLKYIDSTPRVTEVMSGPEESDSDSSSSEEDDDNDDSFDEQSDPPRTANREESYLKLKFRIAKQMVKQELRCKRRIDACLRDPEIQNTMGSHIQCAICWVEFSTDEKFLPLRFEHKRQHSQGEFKACPYCEMCFLYEHYLDKHLEDMGVPTVPTEFSTCEAQDLLYESHCCPVPECNAEFTNRKCLLFHRTNVHDHLHRCQICEKSFVLFSKLRSHTQRIHNYEKRLIPCPVPLCDKSFISRRGVSTHMHMWHKHNKEEKEQWFINSKINGRESEEPGLLAIGDGALPVSRQNHSTPQTFWAMKNSQFSKYLSLRGKKSKTLASRRTSIISSAEPSAELSASPLPTHTLSSTAFSKPMQDTPTSKSISGIKKCIKRPSKLKRKFITKRSSTSSEFVTERGKSKYDGLFSLPPKDADIHNKRRNQPTTPLFPFLCTFCTRAFRTIEDRGRHIVSIHKVDLSLERPYLCPVPNCTAVVSHVRGRCLLRHLRINHPPFVEEEFLRKALEEDKAAEEFTNALNHTAEQTHASLIPLPAESPIIHKQKFSRSRNIRGLRKRILPARIGHGKHKIRPILSSKWKLPQGPKSILIRELLSNFKQEGGFYCAECPLGARKTITTTFSMYRHLDLTHPNSAILNDPESVDVEALKADANLQPTSPLPPPQQSPTKLLSEDEGEELDPTCADHELNEKHDENNFTTTNSDIITSSDQDHLTILRNLFVLCNRRRSSYLTNLFTCPLCPSGKTHSKIYNLQRHFLTQHEGSDYLLKSKLPLILQAKIDEKAAAKKVKVRLPFKRQDRRGVVWRRKENKETMKRKPNVTGLYTYLTQFTRKSPNNRDLKIYYCPVCPSEETAKTFSSGSNCLRHIKINHPGCDLLKKGPPVHLSCVGGSSTTTKNQGNCNQKRMEEDGNSSDESDMEVAPPRNPETDCEDDVVPTPSSTEKAEEVNVDGSSISFRDPVSTSHPNKPTRKESSGSGRSKEADINDDLFVRKFQSKVKPKLVRSHTTDIDDLFIPKKVRSSTKRLHSQNKSDTASNNSSTTRSSINGTVTANQEERAISILTNLLPQIDATKIKCPLCPPQDKVEARIFPNYFSLFRHLSRFASHQPGGDGVTFVPHGDYINLNKWRCNWCVHHFANKQRLTIHVTKVHPTVSVEEYNMYTITLAQEMFGCDKCEESFRTSGKLAKHTCPKADDNRSEETATSSKQRPAKRRHKRALPEPKYREISSNEDSQDLFYLKKAKQEPSEDSSSSLSSSDSDGNPDPEELSGDKATFPCSTCSRVFEASTSRRAHSSWCRKKLASAGEGVLSKAAVENESILVKARDEEELPTPTPSDLSFMCRLCRQLFKSRQSLQVHSYWCKKKQGLKKRQRKSHTTTTVRRNGQRTPHYSFSNERITCAYCPRQFDSGKSIGAHMRWSHADICRSKSVSPLRGKGNVKRPKLADLTDSESDSNSDEEELDPEEMEEEKEDYDDDDDDDDDEMDISQETLTPINDMTTSSATASELDDDLFAAMTDDDPSSTILQQKCSYCDEWFTSDDEKMQHTLQEHGAEEQGEEDADK